MAISGSWSDTGDVTRWGSTQGALLRRALGNPETGLGKSDIAFKQFETTRRALQKAYQVLDKLQPNCKTVDTIKTGGNAMQIEKALAGLDRGLLLGIACLAASRADVK